MPALQIRDLSNSLYESLKMCATRHHRSLAQEATVAIESYVMSGQQEKPAREMQDVTRQQAVDTLNLRRAAVYKRIQNRGGISLPPEFEDAASLVHAVREERDGALLRDRG